jgi:hypothetical protein
MIAALLGFAACVAVFLYASWLDHRRKNKPPKGGGKE